MSTERYERMNMEQASARKDVRVAAYCRVSTDQDDQANSFESQQRFFRRMIEQHSGWKLFEIYADEGLSGTTTKKRKEFNRMISCAIQGKIDLIVTKEISRFARNTLDSISYTRELKRHGVGVYFMNDNINTLDGDSELRLAIMSSIAQEESRRTSERVKWGQKRRMEQGVVFGRSMLGYDVRNGSMVVNENGARVVRMIFHKFLREGKGVHVICRELNNAGIRPMRGVRWTESVILRILRNEKYCGDLVQQKTYTPDFLSHDKKYNHGQVPFVILKDHHEPIVSRDVFQNVNRILDARSQGQKGQNKFSNRYPFSGKIQCGRCGSGYAARTKKVPNGSAVRYWRCLEASKNGSPKTDNCGTSTGCTGRSIRNEDALQIMALSFSALDFDREGTAAFLTALVTRAIESDSPSREMLKTEAIAAHISGLLSGTNRDEYFLAHLLDKMTVLTPRRIDVAIRHLPFVLKYTADGNTSAASVPISVRRPLSSSNGME